MKNFGIITVYVILTFLDSLIFVMNYLAHIFLSGIDDEILIGNFIGDYVKGKDYNKFPDQIRRGILLHRHIDSFTDTHKIVLQSMRYFQPKYGHYAGIIVDMLYDHYLVLHWDKYAPVPLDSFKENVFAILSQNHAVMPERVQFFVPSFIKNDWIGAYTTIEGLLTVFHRMSLRTSLPNEVEFAREILRKYYIQLESEFLTYFPQLIQYVVNEQQITIALKDNSLLKT